MVLHRLQPIKICTHMKTKLHKYAISLISICKVCRIYAENMHKYAQDYAENMHKFCRICISLCCGIFCIYIADIPFCQRSFDLAVMGRWAGQPCSALHLVTQQQQWLPACELQRHASDPECRSQFWCLPGGCVVPAALGPGLSCLFFIPVIWQLMVIIGKIIEVCMGLRHNLQNFNVGTQIMPVLYQFFSSFCVPFSPQFSVQRWV